MFAVANGLGGSGEMPLLSTMVSKKNKSPFEIHICPYQRYACIINFSRTQ